MLSLIINNGIVYTYSNFTDLISAITNYGKSSITSIKVSGKSEEQTDSANGLFSDLTNAINIDVTGLDTINITDMGSMFKNCTSVTNLDVGNFNTKNVTNMGDMFYHCESITTLDVNNFYTKNVQYMTRTFNGCSSLTTIYCDEFNTSSLISGTLMFTGCTNLVGAIRYNILRTGASYANSSTGYFTLLNKWKIPKLMYQNEEICPCLDIKLKNKSVLRMFKGANIVYDKYKSN